jgi:hypothetical protein
VARDTISLYKIAGMEDGESSLAIYPSFSGFN